MIIIAMILLVLAMAMTLTACGSAAQQDAAVSSDEASQSAKGNAEGSENMGNAVAAERANAADAEIDPYEGEYTVKELNIDDEGTNIYARVYLPVEEKDAYPTVIMSHGIGGTYRNCEPYARQFAANGVAAVAFDFKGGGLESRSDGEMVNMSTLTEAQDLEAVTAYVKKLDYVNAEQLFLLGESMGGYVSAYVAGQHPDDYAAIVLYYPAFVLQDDARKKFPDGPETAPEVEVIYGMETGRQSYIDNLSYDIYEVIPGFTKDVLIVHGDADPVVPLSYSERAVEVYQSAKLVAIPGAQHGFRGDDIEKAGTEALSFVQAHLN